MRVGAPAGGLLLACLLFCNCRSIRPSLDPTVNERQARPHIAPTRLTLWNPAARRTEGSTCGRVTNRRIRARGNELGRAAAGLFGQVEGERVEGGGEGAVWRGIRATNGGSLHVGTQISRSAAPNSVLNAGMRAVGRHAACRPT